MDENQPLPAAPAVPSPSRLTVLSRFGGFWAGMTGLFALSGSISCPCCGLPSCPIGIVNASIFSALCACGMNWFTHWKPKPSEYTPPEDWDEPCSSPIEALP